jgi:hypothetical protein
LQACWGWQTAVTIFLTHDTAAVIGANQVTPAIIVSATFTFITHTRSVPTSALAEPPETTAVIRRDTSTRILRARTNKTEINTGAVTILITGIAPLSLR